MPKSKPTQVITHRVELGEWERQNILKPITEVRVVKDAATGTAYLVAAGAFGVAVFILWQVMEELYGWFSGLIDRIPTNVEEVTQNSPTGSPAVRIRNWLFGD
jgi:hypothetical protein